MPVLGKGDVDGSLQLLRVCCFGLSLGILFFLYFCWWLLIIDWCIRWTNVSMSLRTLFSLEDLHDHIPFLYRYLCQVAIEKNNPWSNIWDQTPILRRMLHSCTSFVKVNLLLWGHYCNYFVIHLHYTCNVLCLCGRKITKFHYIFISLYRRISITKLHVRPFLTSTFSVSAS